FHVGNNAFISTQNYATCSGTKTIQSTLVGVMNQDQMRFKGGFVAGDSLQLSVSNTGLDSSLGLGGKSIGTISNTQIGFDASCTVGNNTSITVNNNGNFDGENSTFFGYAGAPGNKQFDVSGNFYAGNFFKLQ